MFTTRCYALLAIALILIVPAFAVEIAKQDDGTFRVTGKTYTAAVDKDGNFYSLVIDGVEVLDAVAPHRGGGFPGGKPAAAVEQQGNTITARSEGISVAYTFADTGVDLQTEGGTVEWWLAKTVNACISVNGQAAITNTGEADIRKVVAGKVAFSLSVSYHIMWGRLMDSRLTRGGKPTDPLKAHIECGVSFDPTELISIVSLEGVGKKPFFPPAYAKGETPQLKLTLKNLGITDVATEVRFRVQDHPVMAKTVFEKTLPAQVPGSGNAAVTVDIPLTAPGPYWVYTDVVKGDNKLKGTQLGILYDADHFRPALTRPADFHEFWDRKLREMRAIPFDAKLTESPQESNEKYLHYTLEITDAKGKRITTFLRVPRKEGVYDAEVDSYWGSTPQAQVLADLLKAEKQPIGAGQWERGADRIRVGAPQPEDSTYTRWNGLDDNNMLDSYLMNVRMEDYLRTLKNVDRIWLFGSSRSGASMLAAAALSPEKVVEVNVHVPTSCGISWAEKPYQGWGRPPAMTPEGLRIASYFDPVNFAPDLVVPVVMDGGFYDNLAPAPDILAFCNWADKSPFRRWALELGGHGFFPPDDRARMEKEMGEFLKFPTAK